MKTIEIDCWEVTEEYDRDSRHVAYFSSEHVAKQFTGKSPYFSVRPHKKTYIISDTIDEHKEAVVQRKKASALAKLTDEEKRLLGVCDD